MQQKNVYTAPEIAKICHVSRVTVNTWIRNGVLRAFRATDTGVWRVTWRDLSAFLKERNYPAEFLAGDKQKVLVIDDDAALARGITRMLQMTGNFEVETAQSGFLAGVKLESFKPDIIILDIFLGDIDGRELLDHIRKHPDLSQTIVIGISGRLEPEAHADLQSRGFHDFLSKPFRMEQLLQVMQRCAALSTVN